MNFQLINDQFVKVWDIYIKFYTAFLALNMAALGLTVEKITTPQGKALVMWAFIAQNGLSFCTAVGMTIYSHRIARSFQGQPRVAPMAAAKWLGVWGGVANAVSHVIFVVLWWMV